MIVVFVYFSVCVWGWVGGVCVDGVVCVCVCVYSFDFIMCVCVFVCFHFNCVCYCFFLI